MKLFKINIISFITIFLIVFMSVGFALYKQDLGLNTNITFKKNGKVEIINVSVIESENSNIQSYTTPSINDLNIDFKVVTNQSPAVISYLATIANNSFYDYSYTGFNLNLDSNYSVVVINQETGLEINPGEVLKAGETINLKVKITITDDTKNEFDINNDVSFSNDKTGSITTSITPKTGSLKDNNIACFTLSVINTYTYKRNFTLSSSNENVLLVDSSGNSINQFTIDENKTSDYEVCMKSKEGSVFLSDTTTTIVSLQTSGVSLINVGEVELSVDIDPIATDKEIPTVGNIKIAIPESDVVEGSAVISWDRIDTGGSSITNYFITLYNADTNTSTNYETDSALTSYTLTNLTEGNYYAFVYGVDEAGNIGSSYCSSASVENGYCAKSNTTNLKWKYTVNFNLTKLTHDGSSDTSTTTLVNQSYSTTLAVNSSSTWDMLPSSVTITMGGNTLTSGTDYTYSNGTITINKVTGDITITAEVSSICLVKGTKITLANLKTKNIEDITYTDLLLVWNYETGTYTYEYPIWIEKSGKTISYQKTTFSDGTILKTVGNHGIFNKDLNMFVSVNDKENFNIGTNVVKIENNKISTIKVVKIEIINEEIEYYHVVSTRYYNIIANNLLTTDGTVILSNLYKFGNNINWLNRDYNKLDLYDYSMFSDIMPYYMFKGLRVEEGKVLNKYLDFNTFKTYLKEHQLNSKMLKEPIKNNKGNRLWMVTTSDDNVLNVDDYLYEENSIYTLKEPKNSNNFKYWYNTSDNKYYNVFDKVKVEYGMHFIAIYGMD